MSEYIIECDYDFDEGWIPDEQREEIVRCRDCEYYEGYTGCCTRRDNIAPMAATPDGFCKWGERE